jgi:hypothetical protein
MMGTGGEGGWGRGPPPAHPPGRPNRRKGSKQACIKECSNDNKNRGMDGGHPPYTRSLSPPPAKDTVTDTLPGRDPGAGGPHANPTCRSTCTLSLARTAVISPLAGSAVTTRLPLEMVEGEEAEGLKPPLGGSRMADRGGSTMAAPTGANRTRTPGPHASSCTTGRWAAAVQQRVHRAAATAASGRGRRVA